MADIRFALSVGKTSPCKFVVVGGLTGSLEVASSGSIGLGRILLHPEIEHEILAAQLAGISISGSIRKGGLDLDFSHNEWEPYVEKVISAPSKHQG